MKKLFLILFLLPLVVFGAVSSSTLTTVSSGAVYYVSTDFTSGVRSSYISLYVNYTKGSETSYDVVIAWYPNTSLFAWSSTYYNIGERASDETMQNITLKFDTTGNTMYRFKVPAGVSRMYILTAYSGSGSGTLVLNTVPEKDT